MHEQNQGLIKVTITQEILDENPILVGQVAIGDEVSFWYDAGVNSADADGPGPRPTKPPTE